MSYIRVLVSVSDVDEVCVCGGNSIPIWSGQG